MIKLKYWMIVKNMTAKELAEVSGVDHGTVSRIATGRIKNPFPTTIHKLAKGLEIEVSELIKEV
jgi:transcriptional regulator with XRE-family HTH domain